MDDVKISRVKLGNLAPLVLSKHDLLNGEDCQRWICKRKNLIGWTYSFNPSMLRYFKRLIAHRGELVLTHYPNVKFARNNHMKCYIDQKEMLIGSYNLVHPTILDMCVVVKDMRCINYMTIQFNKHWKVL